MSVKGLRKFRSQLGVTRYRMAQLLGISKQRYSHLEDKGSKIEESLISKFRKIAHDHNISDSQLLDLFEGIISKRIKK